MSKEADLLSRSLPKSARRDLREKLPEAVLLMATSKSETVQRMAEMLALAESVPSLAHLTIKEISDHIVRLDPEFLRGEIEPASDTPVAPVLFKILEMLHFANMYYQKNNWLEKALTPDELAAARLTVYKEFEEVTAEFMQRTLVDRAKKSLGKRKARRNVSKLFRNLQNLKEKTIFASDVVFKWNGQDQHKFIRGGEDQLPSKAELKAYTQRLVNQYSQPEFNTQPQKAEWLVSFGLARNGKINVSKPLSIQVDFRQIPEWLVRDAVDFKSNTGIPLLELASEFGMGFTIGVMGEAERHPIPYETAHRLVISKLPVDLEMLSELLDPQHADVEIMEHDDLVFDSFNLVAIDCLSQLGLAALIAA